MEENPTLKIENVLQQMHCWIVPDVLTACDMGSVWAARFYKCFYSNTISWTYLGFLSPIGSILLQITNYTKHT